MLAFPFLGCHKQTCLLEEKRPVLRSLLIWFLCGFGVLLLALQVWPELDLATSGLFATPQGFIYRANGFLIFLQKTAFVGARILVIVFAAAALVAYFKKQTFLWLSSKSWFFLLLALLIGPGLLANVALKDHWGRARPHMITAFGGTHAFTPALQPASACARNCSFVSGDGAFGFFLTCFAYVVPLRRSRRVFWAGMGVGLVFGGARILIGAHFISDVAYAACLVLSVSALLHALFWGMQATRQRWIAWFSLVP